MWGSLSKLGSYHSFSVIKKLNIRDRKTPYEWHSHLSLLRTNHYSEAGVRVSFACKFLDFMYASMVCIFKELHDLVPNVNSAEAEKPHPHLSLSQAPVAPVRASGGACIAIIITAHLPASPPRMPGPWGQKL